MTASHDHEPTEPGLPIIIEVLKSLDRQATDHAFLQKLFHLWLGVDLSEDEAPHVWQEIIARRTRMSDRLAEPVSLSTAALDVLEHRGLMQDPVVRSYHSVVRIQQEAATDPLTGLYNRRIYRDFFMKELVRAMGHGYPLGLVLWDLRHLKQINDVYGHGVGDQVLCEVASLITQAHGEVDVSGRLGGDEFATVLTEMARPDIYEVVQQALRAFEERVRPLAPEVDLGLNCGAASFPEDGDTLEALFERADRRLYEEKKLSAIRGSTPTESPLATWRLPESAPSNPLGLSRDQRRKGRVSLPELGAFALVSKDRMCGEAKVLDMGGDGLSFLWPFPTEPPDTFTIRLHIPFFSELPNAPSFEFQARRVYAHRESEDGFKVGCQFVGKG